VEELRKAMGSDELKAIWAGQGAEFPTGTPQQFGAFVSDEVKRWAVVVKASGAKLD
jgi:tripartite-type tricarboxylate transporter receptor subunit TctC